MSHRTVFVNNRRQAPLADNDIRGFLDGHITHRWNQPTQSHVRIGRRDDNPSYGEYELFRALQKWSDIILPPGSQLTKAQLRCTIEQGSQSPLHVYLYAVNKDWNTGSGGTRHDNLSAPQTGDVWWNAAAHEQDDWGLPGASFAADDPDLADTTVMPLAVANYHPGDTQLRFSSAALTAYVERKITYAEPLRFLMKLSDFEEDLPGAKLIVFSAEADDDRNVIRRPHLELDWLSPMETKREQKRIMLEYGRTQPLSRIPLSGDDRWIAANFVAAESSSSTTLSSCVTLEVRGGNDTESSLWQVIDQPMKIPKWSWLEVRVLAAADPVSLGLLFTASMRNTWITTGPPAQQQVRWTFVSPSQREHHLTAKYMADFTWTIEYQPDEIGRWQFRWNHHFNDKPFESTVGYFDVVAGTRANIIDQLKRLLADIQSSQALVAVSLTKQFTVRFARLERAAIHCETPESFRTKSGRNLRNLLDEIREALGGTSVPETKPIGHH